MYFVGILNHKYGISLLLWQTQLVITTESSVLCFNIMVLLIRIIIASTEKNLLHLSLLLTFLNRVIHQEYGWCASVIGKNGLFKYYYGWF